MRTKGAVAAGHEITAEAGALRLEAGGNAFDAALAALCAACVAEPVLTSLGGGGFLNARTAAGKNMLFDFFVQTPLRKGSPDDLEFYPILADFGSAQQEFHIGMGSLATPGTVRGLFDVHRELGTLPIRMIVEPAVAAAKTGLRLNSLQAYIFSIVAPIYLATPAARVIYASPQRPEQLLQEGELMRQPDLADTREALAADSDRLFYEGEIGRSLIGQCTEHGGQLQREDLIRYRTHRAVPLERDYRGTRLHLNPPPSSGGLLIAFALAMLQDRDLGALGFGSPEHLRLLSRTMARTNIARKSVHLEHGIAVHDWVVQYQRATEGRPVTARGTTQISTVDEKGNAASLTLSNGEGCGHILPGTGIMLNNMLGEEDLNPEGFHRWREGVRVSSMMAPAIAENGQRIIAIGSGGSNRLRTAILQTLSNLIDFRMNPSDAVAAPRIHVERGLASIEPGFEARAVESLKEAWPDHHLWEERNLFFGGAHTVAFDGRGFDGAGDPRRGGAARVVS